MFGNVWETRAGPATHVVESHQHTALDNFACGCARLFCVSLWAGLSGAADNFQPDDTPVVKSIEKFMAQHNLFSVVAGHQNSAGERTTGYKKKMAGAPKRKAGYAGPAAAKHMKHIPEAAGAAAVLMPEKQEPADLDGWGAGDEQG